MEVKEREISDWYDNWHLRKRYKSWRPAGAYVPLLDLLKTKPGERLLEERLLDVGCGTGFFLKLASGAGLETCGVDVSSVGVALSKQVSPTSIIRVCSMEHLNGVGGPFGYVTAFGSLEHCIDISKGLSEIRRVLVPMGKFIAMVPNSDYDGPKMSVQEEIMETRKSMSEWSDLFRSYGFFIDSIGEDMVMHRPDVPIEKTYQFIFTLRKA